MLPFDSAPKPPSWNKSQTFTSLDFGSGMAPQEGCSVWSQTVKKPAFPLQDTHLSLAEVTNDQPPQLRCTRKHIFRSTGLLCAGLPPSRPPVLSPISFSDQGLLSTSRGNLLPSWTRLSGGEMDLALKKVPFSQGGRVKGFSQGSLCFHVKDKLFKTASQPEITPKFSSSPPPPPRFFKYHILGSIARLFLCPLLISHRVHH